MSNPELNPFASPEGLIHQRDSASQVTRLDVADIEGLYREDSLLVMRKDAQLPDVCIKSTVSNGLSRLECPLSYYPPWVLTTLLLTPVAFTIVALVFREKAKIHIPLCDQCIRRRNFRIMTSTGIVFIAFVIYFIALAAEQGPFILVAGGLLAIGLLYGTVGSRLIHAKKISGKYLWITGADSSFLALLPEAPSDLNS